MADTNFRANRDTPHISRPGAGVKGTAQDPALNNEGMTITTDNSILRHAPDSFGSTLFLRVLGDSMFDPAAPRHESFPPGCNIHIAEKVAQPGEFVAVRLAPARGVIFRRLKTEGTQQLLEPLNPKYPTTPLPADAGILGVVVAMGIAVPHGVKRSPSEQAAAELDIRARLAAQRAEMPSAEVSNG
jgi:hypothetical protein